MYHNHLIASPTQNILISVNIGSSKEAATAEEGAVVYRDSYPLYIDGLRIGDTKRLVIAAKNILYSYYSEGLYYGRN